jgi:hypothetical protein
VEVEVNGGRFINIYLCVLRILCTSMCNATLALSLSVCLSLSLSLSNTALQDTVPIHATHIPVCEEGLVCEANPKEQVLGPNVLGLWHVLKRLVGIAYDWHSAGQYTVTMDV